MGAAWSKSADVRPVVLPAAKDVDMDAAPYDLPSLKTPVLSGWRLALFVKLAVKSFVWDLIAPTMFRNSGLTHPLREVILPESPCYEPILDHGSSSKPDSVAVLPISCSLGAAQRADQAAVICPSWRGDKGGDVSSRRRLQSRPRIRDFYDTYSSGTATPREVIRDTLEVVRLSETMTPPMRFFISINEDDVMRQADASAARWASGSPLSVLDGVPMAVKDHADQLPYETTSGTTFMAQLRTVTCDAQHVKALKDAGAILLGKANMHEIGQGVTGWNSHYGPTRNPANPEHFTGGSSSGSAGLVAAGICPVCIGADGGGSIRIPSAFCGVFGMMPTYGRTKEDDKMDAGNMTFTFGTNGPIAGSTEDLAIVYAVMCNLRAPVASTGCRPGYCLPPQSVLLPAKWPTTPDACSLSGLKVGIYDAWFDDAEPSIVSECRKAVALLQDMGAEIVPIVIPELGPSRVAHTCLISSEMYHSYSRLAHFHPKLFDEMSLDIQVSQKSSSCFTASDVYQSQKFRTRATVFFNRLFEKVDVIVTPTTGISAPRIHSGFGKFGESNLPQLSQIMKFITSANLVGFPAMSVPVGRDDEGLPVGLQLMGRPWSEATLLDCAHKLEVVLGEDVAQREPEVALGVLRSSRNQQQPSVASPRSRSKQQRGQYSSLVPPASPFLKMAG